MEFGFSETQSTFQSGPQQARRWTERGVADSLYCPNCGAARLSQFPANLPVADFYCEQCSDQFEVKAKNGSTFGRSVADGAYETKIERLTSRTNPNLILVGYNKAAKAVHTVCLVPKHFFVPEIIQKRKPLSVTARRAGWVGSNILLHLVPTAGQIYVVKNGVLSERASVLEQWGKTAFLQSTGIEARGWLIEVMKVVESIERPEFTIADVYAYEQRLSAVYPENNNVRAKIRQQLQVLRDHGYLEFLGRGRYRLANGGVGDGVVS